MRHLTISINAVPGFEEWRTAARSCLERGYAPHEIIWQGKTAEVQSDLFSDSNSPPISETEKRTEGRCFSQLNHGVIGQKKSIKIPKSFIDQAETAVCHADDGKYALLYKVLWRLVHENRNLLAIKTDPDVMRLNALVKNVRRDAYKITAFLRFREIEHEGEPLFIAWYEPEHYTLERVLTFFKTRFKNMRWSILTPYRAAHWDKNTIKLVDNPDPSLYPADDKVEGYWLTYYANIFNPARPKKKAMLSQMPKKYWKNMPETVLVQDLLRSSESRAREMIDRMAANAKGD